MATFDWKTQGGVLTCLSGSGNVLGTVKQSGDKFVASAFGKEAEFNFERSAKTFVQAAAGRPAQVRAADADKHPLHAAVDKMCDAKGIEKRDHLHRALDAVLAHRAKATDTETKPQATIYGQKVEPSEGARERAAKQAAKNRTHAVKMNAFRKQNGAKDLLKPPSIVMDSAGRLALEPVGK